MGKMLTVSTPILHLIFRLALWAFSFAL